MRTPTVALILCVALGVAAPASHADDRTWYGWQTLGIDVAADITIVSGRHSTPALALAWGAFALGPPLVHGAHDDWGRAGLSAGMRVGGSLLGGAAGLVGCDAPLRRTTACVASVATGVVIAMLAAQVIDGAVLAFEDAPTASVQLMSFGGSF